MLMWYIHKPYEFLVKEQCPQLDLKLAFLCGCSYGKWGVHQFYFIVSKWHKCKKHHDVIENKSKLLIVHRFFF